MESIFSKIVAGKIPCYKIYEDQNHLAFLDINPFALGHTLVIPKKEVNKIYDLSLEEYQNLMGVVYKLSKVIEKAISCKRVGLTVLGLEVPHAHVHLVPLNTEDDMNIHNKLKLTEKEFLDIAEKIKLYL